MNDFVTVLLSGLTVGAAFTLTAVGFLLIFEATGVVNFAQGDLMTLGAYVMVWMTGRMALGWGWAAVLTLVVMLAAGVILERVAVAPLRSRNLTVSVVATLGASLMIQALLVQWQGATLKSVPSPFANDGFRVGSVNVQVQQVILIAVTVLVVLALIWTLRRTGFGRDLRALAGDRETAALYGVPVARFSMLSWGSAAALAGLGAILAGPLAPISLTFGFSLMFGAFGAAMLGGFGSVAGAAIAAALVGITTSIAGHYWLDNYSVVVPYAIIIAVIAFRPTGLVKRTQERL